MYCTCSHTCSLIPVYLVLQSMGSCFLSLLEAQSSMLTSALEVMGPLGSYKEVGQRLIDSKTTSVVKEATLGWLAAAQVL